MIPSRRAVVFALAYLAVLILAFHVGLWASRMMPRQEVFTLGGQETVTTLPGLVDVNVTLPEVLDILADYDIVHESKLMNFMHYYGLTDPDTSTIYINTSQSHDSRTETLIHEIVHVIYMRRGVLTSGPYEHQVEAKAQETFKALYGARPSPLAPLLPENFFNQNTENPQ